MKISEIITDKYKLRIPPTVYYELLADVVEAEEEQEPCDDVISRQVVKDKYRERLVNSLKDDDRGIDLSKYTEEPYKAFCEFMDSIPPVKQEPKAGHWIIKDGKEQGYDIGGIKTWYIQIMCDKCGFIKTVIEGHTGQYKYCPNCGARMVGE